MHDVLGKLSKRRQPSVAEHPLLTVSFLPKQEGRKGTQRNFCSGGFWKDLSTEEKNRREILLISIVDIAGYIWNGIARRFLQSPLLPNVEKTKLGSSSV